MLSVRVNCLLVSKIITLSRHVLEVPYKPLVSNVVLLTLPTLVEQSDPKHDDNAIDDTQWMR